MIFFCVILRHHRKTLLRSCCSCLKFFCLSVYNLKYSIVVLYDDISVVDNNVPMMIVGWVGSGNDGGGGWWIHL